jgi:aarF domain-containing kinase
MPPGPVYNWLCVVCSAADILSHAARIRTSQLAPRSSTLPAKNWRKSSESKRKSPDDTTTNASTDVNDHFDVTTVRPRPDSTLGDVDEVAVVQALSIPTSFANISSAEAVQNAEQLTQHGRIPSAERPMEILTPGIHPDKVLVNNRIRSGFN